MSIWFKWKVVILQDRLIKELRLKNINTIDEANTFLKEEFLPKFNTKFSVIPTKVGNVHRLLTQEEKQHLGSIFSVKSVRRVNQDFTIQFKSKFYQLEQIQPTTIRPKESILMEEWLDQTVHLKFKEMELKYFLLQERPKKVRIQPTIITNHPLNWKPPINHPWRQYKNKILP